MCPYSHRTANQSRKFADQKRKRLVWGVILAGISLLTWLYSLSALSRFGAFAIDQVSITGADPDIAANIQPAVDALLQGNYWRLFSRSNSLIYPRAAIAVAAEAASPQIESVSVSRNGLRGIVVAVTEKAPAALVCATLPDFDGDQLIFSDSGSCYHADASGMLFQSAASSSDSSYNRYFIPDLGDSGSAILGSAATSSAEWAALQSFYGGLRMAGIEPEGILMKDQGEYELYVPGLSSAATSTTVIYFDDRGGFAQELSDLVSFWGSAAASTSFDYIDLRYAPNVFYRQSK